MTPTAHQRERSRRPVPGKEVAASLLRSPWRLSAAGLEAAGRQCSALVAVLRRIWDVLPYVGDVWVPFVFNLDLFHFDFADAATGRPVMVSKRRGGVRDRCTVTVPTRGWTAGSPRRRPSRWTRCRAADGGWEARGRGRGCPW